MWHLHCKTRIKKGQKRQKTEISLILSGLIFTLQLSWKPREIIMDSYISISHSSIIVHFFIQNWENN